MLLGQYHPDDIKNIYIFSPSGILNIAQDGDPWPLYIKDHEGRTHRLVLEPGQMVWYESARLVHGRPVRFRGNYYDNVFVHFKPADRRWYGLDIMQVGVILKTFMQMQSTPPQSFELNV